MSNNEVMQLINYALQNKSDRIEQLIRSRNLDWLDMLRILKQQRIFPWLFKYIKDYIPNQYINDYTKEYNYICRKTRLQKFELLRLIDISQRYDMPFILVKGMALGQIIYGDLDLRSSGDLDLLMLDENDCVSFKNLLISEYGCKQFPTNTDYFYAFHEFWMIGVCGVNFEIKKSTSAFDMKYINEFKRNTMQISIGNRQILTSDLNHTFLHLVSNAYENSEKRLGVRRHTKIIDFLDLELFLLKYLSDIDWEYMVKLADKYEMKYKVFCILNDLDELFPVDIKRKTSLFKGEAPNGFESNGSRVAWKMPITERIFYPNVRQQEYIRLIYDRMIKTVPVMVDLSKGTSKFTDDISREIFGEKLAKYSFEYRTKTLMVMIELELGIIESFNYCIRFMFVTPYKSSMVSIDKDANGFRYQMGYDVFPNDGESKGEWIRCDSIIDNTMHILCPICLDDIPGAKNISVLGYNVLVDYKIPGTEITFFLNAKFCEEYDPEEWYENLNALKLFNQQ